MRSFLSLLYSRLFDAVPTSHRRARAMQFTLRTTESTSKRPRTEYISRQEQCHSPPGYEPAEASYPVTDDVLGKLSNRDDQDRAGRLENLDRSELRWIGVMSRRKTQTDFYHHVEARCGKRSGTALRSRVLSL